MWLNLLCLKTLNILKGILVDEYDVKIEFNDSNAKFVFSNLSLTCRLIDGNILTMRLLFQKKTQMF